MKKTKKFLFDAFFLTVISFLMRSIHLSFSVYLSNTVGPEAMGTYHLILPVYFFSVTLATSGIGFTVTRMVSEAQAFRNERKIKAIMKKAIVYCLFFSGIAVGLLLCFSKKITELFFQNTITALPLYILAVSLPFLSVSSAISGFFVAKRKISKTAPLQLAEQMVKIGVTLGLLRFIKPDSLTGICCVLVSGGTTAEIVSFFALWFVYRFEQRKSVKASSSGGVLKELLSIAFPVAFSSYLRSGLSSLKQMSVPKRLKQSGVSNAVAAYGIINAMVMPVLMFPSVVLGVFSSLIVPEITEKYVLGHKKSLNRILSTVFKLTLLFAVLTGGILFLYAKELSLAIYQKTEVIFYLKILAPLVVIMYLDDIVDAILKGIDEQLSVVRINMLDSAISIFLLYYLLPVYHIKGYLMVIFIGEILNGTLSILCLIRRTDFHFSLINWVIIPAGVVWISMLSAKVLLPFHFGWSIGLSAVLYAGILYAVGILKPSDFKL